MFSLLKRKKKYEVISEGTIDDLERKATDYLERGYKPVGSVFVLRYEVERVNQGYSDTYYRYYQSFVK